MARAVPVRAAAAGATLASARASQKPRIDLRVLADGLERVNMGECMVVVS